MGLKRNSIDSEKNKEVSTYEFIQCCTGLNKVPALNLFFEFRKYLWTPANNLKKQHTLEI